MKKIKIVKFANGKLSECFDAVAEECAVNLFVNGTHTLQISASCSHYKQLIYGYLFTEGLINNVYDVQSLRFEERNGSLCAFAELKENSTPLQIKNTEIVLSKEKLFVLSNELSEESTVFKQTGGAHIAALSDGNAISGKGG